MTHSTAQSIDAAELWKVAEAIMKTDPCGYSLPVNGEHVLCCDPRLEGVKDANGRPAIEKEVDCHCLKSARAAINAMSTPSTALRGDGWKLVPVEPTEEMKDAFYNLERGRFVAPKPAEYWKAMLAASPTSDVSEPATTGQSVTSARIAELEAALKPFADQAGTFDSYGKGEFVPDRFEPSIVTHTIGDLRRARKALGGEA